MRRSGTRKFAVGRVLGIGHIALWMFTFYAFLRYFAWGENLLASSGRLTAKWGDQVSGSMAASWHSNGILIDSATWLRHLPLGTNPDTYFVLAFAVLVVRLARRLPGWLSLVIALPGAVYGLLRALVYFPALATFWPISAVTLIVAWFIVARTIRNH
ncbi:MAG: hypothetical protein JWM19_6617 [Actinomycetia bacterium]|nr:hypothetical protein [Actinomycetes bacterium]